MPRVGGIAKREAQSIDTAICRLHTACSGLWSHNSSKEQAVIASFRFPRSHQWPDNAVSGHPWLSHGGPDSRR